MTQSRYLPDPIQSVDTGKMTRPDTTWMATVIKNSKTSIFSIKQIYREYNPSAWI